MGSININGCKNIFSFYKKQEIEPFERESRDNKITLYYRTEEPNENIRLVGEKFYENNKENCKMVIDKVEKDCLEFYKTDKTKLKVTLAIGNKVTDLSHMFDGCSSLTEIPDFNNLKFNQITNISYLFSGCTSLKSISNILELEKNNITDISFLFFRCSSLKALPDLSNFNTDKVTDMSYIFYECSSLIDIPNISYWNTKKVKNMKSMFSFASSIKKLTRFNEWNTNNVENISNMFHGCSSLEEIEGIENWNTNNVTDISYIFCKCSSLKYIGDISKWNTDKVANMSYLFYGCSSLTSMYTISEWNTINVIDMSYMFYNCSKIKSFPYNISKWKTNNVENMSYMFYNCYSLNEIDDISNWNTEKVTDITMIFYNCPLEKTIDFSKWKCYKKISNEKIDETNKNEHKLEVKCLVDNNNLEFIPKIELKFNHNFVNYGKNLLEELKKEIKQLIKSDNFSIILFKKGSLTVVLTLQYLILKNLKLKKNKDAAKNVFESFFDNINSDVKKFAKKIKEHNFISLGSTKPDLVDDQIIDIKNEENKIKMKRIMLEKNNNKDGDDILRKSKTFNIKMEDIEKFYNKLGCEADEKEDNIKKFIDKSQEYNKLFDEEIEKAFKESVFEYTIVHILIVEKDDTKYLEEKSKCPNLTTKNLFHGTNVNAVTGILSSQFRHASCHIFGIGTYFTDILDYAWFYAGEKYRENCRTIPKVGDTFTCVASEIYYDNSKLEVVYNCDKMNVEVVKNGIRCAYADFGTKIMDKKELEKYNGFIGNEFVLTDSSQYLPIYGVTFKRVEYLVIWRDYNFSEYNKDLFGDETNKKIQTFHEKIKKLFLRELDCRIYCISTTEEALKLVNRKKYNKIVIITNGNNNGQDFIIKARRIIGSNPIAAVSALNIEGHDQWIKNLENVLLINDVDFHAKFIKCIKMKDKNYYEQLRQEIINFYSSNIPNFNLREPTDDLFNFPNFKEEGTFQDLNFELNEINADIYNSQLIISENNSENANLIIESKNINQYNE